jgi:hypothetical protein
MTPDESELELYTTALRGDLPKASDEARVRKLLAEAGVLASSVAAPGMALGAATAGGGVAAKLTALPLAVKVGGALVLAGVVAPPVVRHAVSAAEPPAVKASWVAPPGGATPAAGSLANAESRSAPASAPGALETAVAPVAPAVVAARVEPAGSRTPSIASRADDGAARAATAPVTVGGKAPASPSVLSFEVAPAAPSDEGTLRAETALIEGALTALRRGDSAAARRSLAEHSARFPQGQLVRERERALAKVAEKETSHDSR